MAKKTLKQRIFFFERLEHIRQRNHSQLKSRIGVHKRNISFLNSGFSTKEEYIEAVSAGFLNLKDFRAKTGFSLYIDYKNKSASGFSTKQEWEAALEKGFETKAESDLALRVKTSNKTELIALVTSELYQVKDDISLIESEIRSFQKLISSEYDKHRLLEYKNELIARQQQLKKLSEINDHLHVVEHDDFVLMLVIFENKRLKLLEDLVKHLDWIETRFPYLEKWNKVTEVINSFHSNIPVQSDRIAELAELQENEVIQLLLEISSELPSLGEFLQREQVFIRKTKTEDDLVYLLDEMKRKQIAKDTKLSRRVCINCGSEIDSYELQSNSKCQNCDELIPTCQICRGPIFRNDEVLIEENCGSLFHKRHILEWVNVQGICPICRTRINVKSLKETGYKD